MAESKEYPILFSAPMIRALLAGRKTQTRRMEKRPRLAHVKAGDRLWVRETFCNQGPVSDPRWIYRADISHSAADTVRHLGATWKPSIFMPRRASRITLEATEDAREQELWDIKAWECCAEGVEGDIGNAVPNFAVLWDSINGKTAPWSSNPVLVRLAFRMVRL